MAAPNPSTPAYINAGKTYFWWSPSNNSIRPIFTVQYDSNNGQTQTRTLVPDETKLDPARLPSDGKTPKNAYTTPELENRAAHSKFRDVSFTQFTFLELVPGR